jgi:2-C-methyl-D-erythritol 4-phosphate cytidylyltransferase
LNKKQYALIVAGGKGTRIKSKTPKQFLELCGKPILLHTIGAFLKYDPSITIILVLPANDLKLWTEIVEKYNFTTPLILQEGGDTRFQSVKNGLQKIQGDGLVAIHDGVRPLVSEEIISTSFKLAAMHQSAVASVELKESIRVTEQNSTKALDRSKFRLIQTPQTFDVQAIKKAYAVSENNTMTDDASVAENAGMAITLFEGSYSNIKITTPEDLLIAEILLKNKAGL